MYTAGYRWARTVHDAIGEPRSTIPVSLILWQNKEHIFPFDTRSSTYRLENQAVKAHLILS